MSLKIMTHYLHNLEADNERLEAENKRLREENEKLRAEQVCHADQCKLEEIRRLREENKQLKIIFQNTTTVLLHDMPRNNCIGCQLAILEGEELCSRMERLILKGGGE